jgi:PAS domain S-box-containing protein
MSAARNTFIRTALDIPAHPARRRPLAACLALAWAAVSGCSRSSPGVPNAPLTTVEEIRQLAPEAAAAQLPVHLRGTVTFTDTAVLMLVMQDATGAVRVEGAPLADLPLEYGRAVELTGVVTGGGLSPAVTCGSIVMGGRVSPLPAPVRPSARDLVSGRLQYRYVEIEGLVRSAAIDHAGRVALVMRTLGWDVRVGVRDLSFADYRSLPDALVRVRGVLGTSFDATGAPIGVKLWARNMGEVTVVKPAPAALDVPLQTAKSVLAAAGGRPPEHRIRLRGLVALEGGELILRDSTGSVLLRPGRSEGIAPGGPFCVLGFAGQERGAPVLTEATVSDWSRGRPGSSSLPVLATVAQVKALSEDQARLGYPIHLRAVVTYHNPAAGNTFAQDATGGIYLVFRRDAQPAVHARDLVEVEGRSRPGNFAPVVVVTGIRAVGGAPFPQPARIDMEQLFTGIADSTWVEAQGVVHSIGQEHGLRTLGVNWGAHHFLVYVFGSTKLPDSLLDSHIRIQGVCGSMFNFKRQILGMHLFVPDAGLIRVEGSGAPEAPPLRAIEQLLQFSSSSRFGERSRIRGVVTLAHPSGPTCVSDATGGVLVQNHAPASIEVGDAVEVIGLPVAVQGRFNPVLRDAEIRKLGQAAPYEPMLVTATDILDEGYDAELVRIDALLADQAPGKGNQTLVLQAGDRVFEARLDRPKLPAFQTGSLLRVTGIVSMATYEAQQTVLPRSFAIVMRSPADVVVLEPAPWWTASRAFRVLGLVCAVALLALVWIVVLRRRVRLQTADLRESRQMLQLVLDHIPERVFWKDREGRYLGCNKACAGDAGVPAPQDIVGKTDHDLDWRANADAYVAGDRQVIESGQPKLGYEEPQTGADGTHRWLRTSKTPLYGPRGDVIGLLGAYEDITERKRAEEKLQRYSAQLALTNEELKRFTYIVSHDLRAPLLSLRGFAAELRRSLEALRKPVESVLENLAEPERSAAAQALDEAVPEALGFIESSVTRMDHLISALLRLSRVGYREFHLEDLDTGELLNETLRSLAHQIESRKVELKIGPMRRITSDRTAIEQIFGNLLDNALKYLDPRRPGRIEVSARETAEGVVFEVRDNGRGIAEEDMDKVFAPFRRAGPQDVPGEGMGLAYVRALLHRLGGRIECQSQAGVGTTFRFVLPASQ